MAELVVGGAREEWVAPSLKAYSFKAVTRGNPQNLNLDNDEQACGNNGNHPSCPGGFPPV